MTSRVGILTGGGDCPGLNAVIRSVVRSASGSNREILGIKNGWLGLYEGDVEPLDRNSVTGILPRGGTILGTSRFNPTKDPAKLEVIHGNWSKYDLSALIVVGGEGSLSAALEMWRDFDYPVVGVPKTIDNDLWGTDFTFGFDTAVGVVTDAVDRLHSTAESHHRVMVVEVMGRHSGWIAAYGGIAGGADVILVPEHPFRLSRVCERLTRRLEQGRAFSIIVVAEDAHPHPDENFLSGEERERIYKHERLGGIGAILAHEIEARTGIETRVTSLGYVQRGGSPSPFDRVLATRFGIKAFDMVIAQEWGQMVSLQGNVVTSVPLEGTVCRVKYLDEEIYRAAEIFFG
jgi:phosphofructokinase-like protein